MVFELYKWMTFRWLTIFQHEYLAVPSRTLADPVKYLNSMNFPVGHWNRTIAWVPHKCSAKAVCAFLRSQSQSS